MKALPIEAEDIVRRLYGNQEYKKRNGKFGTIKEVMKEFPDEETVLFKIFEVRFKKTQGGCPKCGNPFENFKKVPTKLAYRCRCGHKVHPLAGTHLQNCRLSLLEILDLFYEMFCSKNGSPATWFQRRLGIEYPSAWVNLHKLSDWMGYYTRFKQFTPGTTIQIDIVYPKGITGNGKYFKHKRGLGSERTFATVVMTEIDDPESGFHGITKAFKYDKTKPKELENIIKMYIKKENKHNLYTDDGNEFEFLNTEGYNRHTVNHSIKTLKGKYKSEYIDKSGNTATCTTNDVEGINTLIKTTIHRIYRGVAPIYIQLYVDRVAFNQTNKSRNFFETLNELLSCLPALGSEVEKNFKVETRVRIPKENDYEQAA